MKKTVSIFLAVLMVITALPLTAITSFAATSGDFEYSVISEEDKTCEITKYKGSAMNLAIPSTLDGYNVISIGDYAFRDCTSFASVTIPNSVTSIGEGAFNGCTSLTSVTIPDSVASIGSGAFYDCIFLASITIPDNVTSIGDYAFAWCESLASITIPDSVTDIGNGAFSNCTSLASVTIGNSVTSIGDYAFRGCTSLTSITIPDSVTSIGWSAFEDCTSLESITIPDSVTSIVNYAFYNCASLTDVYYTGTEEQWNAIGIGGYNEGLTSATIHYNYVISNLNGLDNESSKQTGHDNDEKATNKLVEDNQVWFYLGLIVAILIIVAIITWLVLSRRKRKNGNKQVD